MKILKTVLRVRRVLTAEQHQYPEIFLNNGKK